MQLAKIQGRVTCTVKHKSFTGQKLLVCQPLGADQSPNGDPLIVIDQLGAGFGDLVFICSDAKRLRMIVSDTTTPIRWFVLGIVDE
jgi:ethanolamine utilization protein EutN